MMILRRVGLARHEAAGGDPRNAIGGVLAQIVFRRAHESPDEKSGTSRWIWPGVAGLLIVYAVMAWTASFSKGLSFDEGLQLATGYNLWLNGDYRIEGANGDFVKRWATLPYLVSRPRFVSQDDPYWKNASAYALGHRFFFELGNSPEALLRQARAMIALLGVATGLLVFIFSRRLFGPGGGLVSLALFAFSPNMLAFGGIVSTDMSIVLTLFGTTACIWGLLHEVTARRLCLSLGCCGAMVLAKPTALVIFPIAAVLVVVRLVAGGPLVMRWRGVRWVAATRGRQAAIAGVLAVAHVAAGWAAIWAHYGFRYAASPKPADATVVFFHQFRRDYVPPVLTALVGWIERTRFLPEGFHRGIDALLANDDALGVFMNGSWHVDGDPWFFPYTIWAKTSPAMFVLVLVAAVFVWRQTRGVARAPSGEIAPTARGTILYALTPHLALIGCYLAIAMTEDLNIGHRHVLPIYPSIYVIAGAVVLGWRGRPRFRLAVVASVGCLAIESLAIRPHYLSYFGPQVGGPASSYRRLVDSSLDWGMDLPGLKRWREEHDPEQQSPLFLAYFGTDSPSYYGIKSRRLPGFFDRRNFEYYPLAPGYYAISATLFEGVYTAAFGPWNKEYERRYHASLENVLAFAGTENDSAGRAKLLERDPLQFWARQIDLFDNLRLARLCAWLRHQRPPLDHIGHSILIWKLDYADLKAALLEAPAELADRPMADVRQFRWFQVRGGPGR